ncbi:uncharacterized protein [Mytilus edulis]|uniref:uncharacterized protein n=1 Tax=Mytilus edulis TaxID=6550 RepID=UPI0039EE0521
MGYYPKLANRLEHLNQLSSFIFVTILATQFVSVYGVHPPSDIPVTWNLHSKPVIFGNKCELSCDIGVKHYKCNSRVRQWIGGSSQTVLCQNMNCKNDTKYHVKEGAPCVYTLIIHNFTMDDLNCDYTCYYGIKTQHKMTLKLNRKDFVSVPDDVRKNISVKEGNIDIKMYIRNGYPSPNCFASLMDRNITQFMEINSTKTRNFFDVELEVTHPINPCRGNATITCHYGNQKVEVLNQYIDDCKGLNTSNRRNSTDDNQGLNTSNRRNSTDDNSTDDNSTDDNNDRTLASDLNEVTSIMYIMVGIIVTLSMVTTCMIIYSWRQNRKNKREGTIGQEEDIPLRQLHT